MDLRRRRPLGSASTRLRGVVPVNTFKTYIVCLVLLAATVSTGLLKQLVRRVVEPQLQRRLKLVMQTNHSSLQLTS